MELVSLLSQQNTINSVQELLKINGAIRQVIIVSAYLDLNLVQKLIEFLEDNYDERVYPTIKIYTDSASSCFFSNHEISEEFKKLSALIADFCSDESGIFLVRYGKLFHSKCFIIQSNNNQKIIIGSLNFTQKGLSENEEIILIGESERDRNTNVTKLINTILADYLVKIESKSQKVSLNLTHKVKPLFLRHILLEGNIFYELKETDPFRFKLNLPDELLDIDAQQIHPLLTGTITNSISVISLLSKSKEQGGLGLGKKIPKKKGSTLSWKKYCIETCYGHWNPEYYTDEINEVIDNRKNIRAPYYEAISKLLVTEESNLEETFRSFVEKLNEFIVKNYPQCTWKFYKNDKKIFKSWQNWHKKLIIKLENPDYYHKLISGITHVTVPDVWSVPLSAIEFEESFLESLLYQWSKEYSKETQNVIAKSISKNLNLLDELKEKIETNDLKIKIERWVTENTDMELFAPEEY